MASRADESRDSSSSSNSDSGDSVDRAVRDFIERQQSGEVLDLDEYCRPFGPRAGELRVLLEEFLGVDSALKASQRPEETVQVSGASWDDPNWGKYVSQLRSRGPAYQRYSFLGEIGKGGMGVVLRVFDNDTRRVLAMKVIKGQGVGPLKGTASVVDSKRLGRFLEEAQVTAQLDHPSIVPVHEVGVDEEGHVYFTMKYVRGKTLRDVFEERAQHPELWPWSRVVGILAQICDAVDYAHDKGVIHRDLKPENVMIGGYGETYVMDWGLARLHDEPSQSVGRSPEPEERVRTRRSDESTTHGTPIFTQADEVMGTPHYMSPEQADARHADVGIASDIYSVGAILYRALAGLKPYESTTSDHQAFSIVRQVVSGPPRAIFEIDPTAPPDLVAICDKAMEREPTDRYVSMKAMAADLRAWLDGRTVSVYRGSFWFNVRRWAARHRTAAVLSALLVITTPLVPAFYFQQRATESTMRSRDLAHRIETAERDRELSDAKAKSEAASREAAEQKLKNKEIEEAEKKENERQERENRERVEQLETRLRERRVALNKAGQEIRDLSDPLNESEWSFGVADRLDDWLRRVEILRGMENEWKVWRTELEREGISNDSASEVRDLIQGTTKAHADFFARQAEPSRLTAIAVRKDRLREIERYCLAEATPKWLAVRGRLAKDTRFSGQSIEPLFGLLPLGPDPGSGLEEFAHLATGIPPRRDALGLLETSPDAAYVLVLLPSGEVVIGSQSVDPSDVNFDPAAKPEESALERVRNGPLLVGKSECTRAQWNRLLSPEESIDSPASSSAMTGVRLADVLRTGEQFGLAIPSMKQWEYGVRSIERIAAGQPVLQGLQSTWEWCAGPGEVNATEAWAMGGADRDGAARTSARLWFDARALGVELASGGSVGFRFVMPVASGAKKARG